MATEQSFDVTNPAASVLRHLSTEIIQAILSQSPDVQSLKSLAKCCSSFHRAFVGAQNHIIDDVLRGQISTNILPDALMTLWSTEISRDPNGRQDCISNLRRRAELRTKAIPLSKALALSEMHADVIFFTARFEVDLSTRHGIIIDSIKPMEFSLDERDRLKRAFYQFELFCKLHREFASDSEPQFRQFLSKFTPWEKEQIASVYEYLFDQISLAFDDVAQHDVEWGKNSINWQSCDLECPHYKEHYLSLGLSWLRTLVTTDTFEERRCLLSPELKEDPHTFFETLWEATIDDHTMDFGDLDEETGAKHFRKAFSANLDRGPATAWRWAYDSGTLPTAESMWDDSVFFDQHDLRQSGYIFFDYDRLWQWPPFQKPLTYVRWPSS